MGAPGVTEGGGVGEVEEGTVVGLALVGLGLQWCAWTGVIVSE